MASARGRGRLSSIDQLPPDADPIIQWAVAEILGNNMLFVDIHSEFNRRLAEVDCGPISRSALDRYKARKIALTRRLHETREIARSVSEAIGPDNADETTRMLVQLIKQASIELFEKGELGSKQLMELARGLSSALSAEKTSASVRRASDAERRAQMETAAEVAAGEVVKAAPELDKKTVLAAIREAYGIDTDVS